MIGELDIVVLDLNLQKVIQIGEVKCWKEPKEGLVKAQEQRARFLKAVRSSKEIYFRSTSTKETYSKEIFQQVQKFFSIGPKGSVALGFDRELSYTFKELRDYRYEMIRCQARQECARP